MDILSYIATEIFSRSALFALAQVLLIDLVLAGDNAIVIGMAAARVPAERRRKVIFWGLVAAVVLRIGLASITVELLQIIGLSLAGGLLLLWVCWRLWRDIRKGHDSEADAAALAAASAGDSAGHVRQAITQIVIADISMSLDNVLGVAGAARDHMPVLVIGLIASIALMGAAAEFVARLLKRYPWISYVGLVIVLYVAVTMIYHGSQDVLEHL